MAMDSPDYMFEFVYFSNVCVSYVFPQELGGVQRQHGLEERKWL